MGEYLFRLCSFDSRREELHLAETGCRCFNLPDIFQCVYKIVKGSALAMGLCVWHKFASQIRWLCCRWHAPGVSVVQMIIPGSFCPNGVSHCHPAAVTATTMHCRVEAVKE
jgi:hypothetical protein